MHTVTTSSVGATCSCMHVWVRLECDHRVCPPSWVSPSNFCPLKLEQMCKTTVRPHEVHVMNCRTAAFSFVALPLSRSPAGTTESLRLLLVFLFLLGDFLLCHVYVYSVQCVAARSALLQALRSHGPPRLACPAPWLLGSNPPTANYSERRPVSPSELALRHALHPRAMSHPPLLGAHHTTPRTGVLAWHRARPLIGRGGRADKHTWIGRTDLTIWVPSRAREAWPPSHTRPSPHPPPHTHTELPRPQPPSHHHPTLHAVSLDAV